MAVFNKTFLFYQRYRESRGNSLVLNSAIQENKRIQAGKINIVFSSFSRNS